ALVLGAVRFAGLGRWSLWLDEVYTLADARHGTGFSNPVGYWLVGAFFDAVGGRPDEFLMRLPAAVFGWLCIPVTAFGLRAFVGRRAAALAALVLALSPWHLYWSQNARFYTLACLLALCVPWLLVGAMRGAPGAVARVVAAVAVGALATLTHPSALMFLGPLVGWTVLGARLWRPAFGATDGPARARARRARRALLAFLIVGVVLGAGWVARVWSTWSTRRSVGDPLHLVLSLGYLATPGLGLLLALALLDSLRRRSVAVLSLFVVVGSGLALALGASFFVRVSAQYVFVFLPFLAALAAAPFGERAGPGRALRRVLLAAVLLLPLGAESALYLTQRHGDRPRWRAAYRYVFDQRASTDLVLGMEAPVAEYYFNPLSDDLRQLTSLVYLNEFNAEVPVAWARYGRRMWFVVNRDQLLDWPSRPRKVFTEFLESACRKQTTYAVRWTPRDLDVEVWRYPAN
ncbi:MAG TPA: hypothetical protein ENJ09_16255, partial [Planctomycetes bacterium]|nr:hypothetical protein [Planctomycetota bacterium]